jgi:hypothetical protein
VSAKNTNSICIYYKGLLWKVLKKCLFQCRLLC